MKEKNIQDNIRFKVSKKDPSVLLFRNNNGQGFVGKVEKEFVNLSQIVLSFYRRIVFGLFPGSADLIGLKSIVITPEMVGKKIAVFVSLEIKKPGEKLKDEQLQWLSVMQQRGAIAGVATSADEALELLK